MVRGAASTRDAVWPLLLALPAVVYAFASFLSLDLVRTSLEAAYWDTALQFVLLAAALVLAPKRLPRVLTWAYLLLVAWVLAVGIIRLGQPTAIVVSAMLLLSPLVALTAATQTAERFRRPLSLALALVLIAQVPMLAAQFLGFWVDESVTLSDRFSGTLAGKGGAASAYLLGIGMLWIVVRGHVL